MDMHIVTKLLQLRRLFQYIIYTCAHLRRRLLTQLYPITDTDNKFSSWDIWRLELITNRNILHGSAIVAAIPPSIPCLCFIPTYHNTLGITNHCSHEVLRIKLHHTMFVSWIYLGSNSHRISDHILQIARVVHSILA